MWRGIIFKGRKVRRVLMYGRELLRGNVARGGWGKHCANWNKGEPPA